MRMLSWECFLISSHIARRPKEGFEDDTYTVACNKWGVYTVTSEAITNQLPPNCGYALSNYVRKTHDSNGGKSVMLATDTIDKICS